ncbi:MAG: tRNA (adenosine(37)-N6)-threonylcarbamoyltransferase complex dimerization subunit type 1 TsaB [Pseudomonadota bacterium]
MPSLLAIDTSTDACSVALSHEGFVTQRLVVEPRRHNQLLLPMLEEILVPGKLRELDAIAYGCGPGSFTGLRVACSAVQGLAFAAQRPCIGVSTLAALAQGAIRDGLAAEGQCVLGLLDARIGEVYAGIYRVMSGRAEEIHGPRVAVPDILSFENAAENVVAVGDGASFVEAMPAALRKRVLAVHADRLPEARDVLELATHALERGQTQSPAEVAPVYVRDEINWKKLSEQGPSR